MVFDFCDGFSARLLKSYSAIGKELDSLADVVSFGVAPGIIVYQLLINSLPYRDRISSGSIDPATVMILIIPALMPICAALRLAIFNLDSTQATVFKGLPTPANALAVISLVIAGHYSHLPVFGFLTGSPIFLVLITILLSILMVTRIPLLSLKVSNLKLKGNEGRYILIGMVLLSLLLFGIAAFPLIIPLYIVASILALLF